MIATSRSPLHIQTVPLDNGQAVSMERFMVTNADDYDHGLATLTVKYDDNLEFLDPWWRQMFEAPNFVTTSPGAPPTPVGGSASAQTVVVGGKLGIIKDPFGKTSAGPVFLGATAPQGQTRYRELALAGDTLLVSTMGTYSGAAGSLAFSVGALIDYAEKQNGNLSYSLGKTKRIDPSPDALTPAQAAAPAGAGVSGVSSWVTTSIDAAPEPVQTPSNALTAAPPNTQQPPTTPTTNSSNNTPQTTVQLRPGDVDTVDVAYQLYSWVQSHPSDSLSASVCKLCNKAAQDITVEDITKQFSFGLAEEGSLTAQTTRNDSTAADQTGKILLATKSGSPVSGTNAAMLTQLLSAKRPATGAGSQQLTDSTDQNFADTGVLVVYRDITSWELGQLRGGGRLADSQLQIKFKLITKTGTGSTPKVSLDFDLKIECHDYNRNGAIFFGDRPLDNPGYSELKLNGAVGVDQANDRLDVYRVEQRLKYLGFPAMGKDRSNTNFDPQNFAVDGVWDSDTSKAAWLFQRVVNYGVANQSGLNTASNTTQIINHGSGNPGPNNPNPFNASAFDTALNNASTQVSISRTNNQTFNYLNAWNAPHWVNVGYRLGTVPLNTRWYNSQLDTAANLRENWGSSWLADWLLARQYAPGGLQTSTQLMFNGVTDANYATTPHDHASHDLGMAFDVGITTRPGQVQPTSTRALIDSAIVSATSAATQVSYQMSEYPDSPTGFVQGWSDANAQWFVRPDTRTVFPVPGSTTHATTNTRGPNTTEGADASQPISAANPAVYRLPTGMWQGQRLNDQRSVTANILSLYSITNQSSQGYQNARAAFTGTDAEKQTKASHLFGSIFGGVYIGTTETQYDDIRYVLKQLGVPLGTNHGQPTGIMPGHQNHFHITMAVPPLQRFPNNLLADNSEGEASMLDTGIPATDAQAILTATPPAIAVPAPNWLQRWIDDSKDPNYRTNEQKELWLKEYTQSIQSGKAKQTFLLNEGYKYAEKGPLGIPAVRFSEEVEFDIGDVPENRYTHLQLPISACYFLDARIQQPGAWGTDCKIEKIIEAPKGRLVEAPGENPTSGAYRFYPKGLGRDQVRFILTNGADKKVDVTVDFRVVRPPNDRGQLEQDAPSLASLLRGERQAFSGFVDLPTTTLAQTDGEGKTAQITLDTTAAGYGWYIDPTPLDPSSGSGLANADFLPTSNPGEWVAKAGSAAAGKMDMLSVLLHEYGHALGLEHSANGHDFMATTLQPGMRRLPTADELAEMLRLAAAQGMGTDVASLADAGNSSAPDAPNAPATPFNPNTPDTPLNPGLPLGGLGVLLAGRLRRTDYGGWTTDLQTVAYGAAPQFDTVANPQFTNAGLGSAAIGAGIGAGAGTATPSTAADGWVTEGGAGAVSFADGAAHLAESTSAQTRLNQVFVMGEHDRYLSFTLSGVALGGAGNGPEDAFEVALLDANTGQSLLGSTGLSHNDAFLNLQADGSEFKATREESQT